MRRAITHIPVMMGDEEGHNWTCRLSDSVVTVGAYVKHDGWVIYQWLEQRCYDSDEMRNGSNNVRVRASEAREELRERESLQLECDTSDT